MRLRADSFEPTPVPDSKSSQRRRHGRVVCQDVTCSLGQILDLSASGMRVRCKGKPPKVGVTIATTIESFDGLLFVGCSVSWVRHVGFMKNEIGVTFVALTPLMQAALARIARGAPHNDTVVPSVREMRRRQ